MNEDFPQGNEPPHSSHVAREGRHLLGRPRGHGVVVDGWGRNWGNLKHSKHIIIYVYNYNIYI